MAEITFTSRVPRVTIARSANGTPRPGTGASLPDAVAVVGVPGREGPPGPVGNDGPPGPVGPPGSILDGVPDPGDLTLLFDNKLI